MGSRARKLVCGTTLSFIFAFTTVTLAFGDFAPMAKTLGVGRIQSTTPQAPVSSAEKLSVPAIEHEPEFAASEALAAPIEREVVIAPPELPSTSSGWRTGLASAYHIGDDGVDQWTANGSLLTEDSMGVAVPVEWAYLLGSTVEINYNGVVVTAVVNDTGGFGIYGRDLDLQPAVVRALGVEGGWGVRTISWRIVG
jgi:3D (Asp-Asp-Asp) domain-containing protein